MSYAHLLEALLIKNDFHPYSLEYGCHDTRSGSLRTQSAQLGLSKPFQYLPSSVQDQGEEEVPESEEREAQEVQNHLKRREGARTQNVAEARVRVRRVRV